MKISSRASARSVGTILLKASPLMLAMVLYGYTVRLPFFLDDGPNFWFLDHINGLQQWGGSLGFPYYRPIAFTLWKLAWAMLGGRYDPALMHLLNVFCFGLAGVLVGLLASRLAPPEFNKRFGLLAGLSVVLFPFSYQAVTLVSGLFHLTLLLGFAISLWAAMHWLDARGGRLALVLCWLGAFFGVFSHENGPLLLPLAIGMVVLVYGVRSLVRSRTLLVIVPVGVISLLYLFLWATLPLGRGLLQFSAEPIRAFADLSEGLIYPLDMFARAFVQNDATNALIFALVIVTLGLGFWISRSRIALYGTGWYFLSIVPSVLLLAPAYVLGSPRLMVLASVGASLFWAAVVARLSSMKRFRWVAAVGVLSVICISGIFFMERAYDFLRMGDYIWRLTHLAESLKLTKNDEMLVLNPPDFLAPLAFNRRFLLSAEGATVMMDFLPYSQLLWLNTGQMFPNVKAFASRNNLRPPADRLYVPYQPFVDGQPLFDLLHKTPRLVVTAFDGDLFWPVYVGGPNLPGPDNMLAIFDQIELLQAEAYYSPNNRLVTVRLRWRLPEAVGARPFVHVYCNTDFIGQSDLSPWGGAYPFSGWQPGETQTEIRQVLLHKSPTPDCLRIQLGVYNEANAQRLKLTDVQHTSYPDDLYPVLLTAASQSIIP